MHPLRTAWVELLRPVPFQYFATTTFDRLRRLHPEAVHKKLELWKDRAADELWGPRWAKLGNLGLGALVALEPHKDGRTHAHALLYHPELSRDDVGVRLLLKNLWEADERWAHRRSLKEGIARVGPAEGDAAASYCAKGYATKGDDLWIDDTLKAYMLKRPWQATLPTLGCSSTA